MPRSIVSTLKYLDAATFDDEYIRREKKATIKTRGEKKEQQNHNLQNVKKGDRREETSNFSFFVAVRLSVRAFCVLFAFCLLFCVLDALVLFFFISCICSLFSFYLDILVWRTIELTAREDEGNVYASPFICLSFQSHFSWCFIHSVDEKSRKGIRHKSIRFYLCKS